jgi:hypothetical protein
MKRTTNRGRRNEHDQSGGRPQSDRSANRAILRHRWPTSTAAVTPRRSVSISISISCRRHLCLWDADVDIMFRSVVDDVGDTVLVSPAKLVPTDSVVDDTDDCVGADVASVTRIPGPLHIGCPFVDCESAVAPVNVSKILLQSHKKFKPLHVPVLPPLQSTRHAKFRGGRAVAVDALSRFAWFVHLSFAKAHCAFLRATMRSAWTQPRGWQRKTFFQSAAILLKPHGRNERGVVGVEFFCVLAFTITITMAHRHRRNVGGLALASAAPSRSCG